MNRLNIVLILVLAVLVISNTLIFDNSALSNQADFVVSTSDDLEIEELDSTSVSDLYSEDYSLSQSESEYLMEEESPNSFDQFESANIEEINLN